MVEQEINVHWVVVAQGANMLVELLNDLSRWFNVGRSGCIIKKIFITDFAMSKTIIDCLALDIKLPNYDNKLHCLKNVDLVGRLNVSLDVTQQHAVTTTKHTFYDCHL